MGGRPKGSTGYAAINGANIYYETGGHGYPLVLVHAAIGHSAMWDAQWAEFGRQYRVIRYDMRGFGRSRMPPGTYSHVDDLFGFFAYLGIERAHMLGASLGGQMATSFTVQHPDRVSALITVGSGVGGRPMSEEAERQSDAIDEVWESGRTEEAIELEIRMWVDGPRRTPEQVDPTVREQIRRMMRENLASEGQGEPAPYTGKPTIERLGEIEVPALIIAGAEDVADKLAVADLLAERIKNARKVVMRGAAHVPNMERPEEFNRLVLEFLGSIDPGMRL